MSIQTIYDKITTSMPNFKRRKSQLDMVESIDKVLNSIDDELENTDGHNLLLIEAPTGTGKSLAYLLACVTHAKAVGKKLVIATATKTLQNQLVEKDIPEFIKHSGFKFSYGLAKGRSNYVCPYQMDMSLSGNLVASDDMFNDNGAKNQVKIQELSFEFNKQRWDGDLDLSPIHLDGGLRKLVTIDRHQCLGNVCPHNQKDESTCPFYLNRASLKKCDVIVTNHSLLLADLELGGGVILPVKPKDYILCVDEGHNLVNYALSGFMGDFELKQSSTMCQQLSKLLHNPANNGYLLGSEIALCTDIASKSDELSMVLDELANLLKQNLQLFDAEHKLILNDYLNSNITSEFKDRFIQFAFLSGEIVSGVNKIQTKIKDQNKEKPDFMLESSLTRVGFYLSSVDQILTNSQYLINQDDSRYNANARWIEIKTMRGVEDFVIYAGVTHVGNILADKLWSKIYGAIVTSATLAIGNSFNYYKHELGLSLYPNVVSLKLNSAFDYNKQAQIIVPRFKYAPEYRSRNEFTEELGIYLAKVLDYDNAYGTLVLFFNRTQLQEVYSNLPSNIQENILLQTDYVSNQRLLVKHKSNIDKGIPSIIFGLNSFAEGVDLPSLYCMNVIISKLPFETHKNPQNMVREYWVQYEKGNYFMDISIPETCIKLIQAVGRLIRSEDDYGQIVICDNRIIGKPYGAILLNSLPEFNRVYNADFMAESFMKICNTRGI